MLELLSNHGSYLGIVVVLVLTGMGLPIPEEVPIISAGYLSSIGTLNPWLALASCLVGALAGDTVIYAIGYHFGHNLIKEHPRFAHLLHAEREAQIERMIRRHGWKVLFLARFLVGIRAPVYLAAGVLRMPFRRFILIDAFCATAVVSLFFGLSYWFGPVIDKWIRQGEITLTVIVVLVVAAVLFFAWRKSRRLTGVEPDASNPDGGTPPSGGPGEGPPPDDRPSEGPPSGNGEARSHDNRGARHPSARDAS